MSAADVNDDFVDLAASFVEHGVEFVVVGAYALAAHGFPRATGDIDVLVRPTAENATAWSRRCSLSARRSSPTA